MQPSEILARAAREGAPVLDGDSATFLWRGARPPRLMGDFTNWETGPLELHPAAPGLWTRTLRFDPQAYIEYCFVSGKKRVPDPLNPRVTPSGLGFDNHFFYMPQGAPTPLTVSPGGFPAGTLTRHELPARPFLTSRTRRVWLYQPAGDAPLPLWLVWDGQDYLERALLVNIMENLVAAGRMRPVALAFVQNGGPNRSLEYFCSEATLAFVVESLLPFARQHLNLLDLGQHPGSYGVMGASMGGLMALYAGLRLPEIFGRVLSQSGAFAFGGAHLPVARDLIQYAPVQPVKVWMDAGKYEWLLRPNIDTHAQLLQRGYDVTYREFPAGHNYPAWRNDLAYGLEHLLG
jgi:enterochelin esterase family protein